MPKSITIVGASLAGMRAAETLRNDGFDGTITLIGAEKALPYDRPPLSKQVLSGKWEAEKTRLYTDERMAELGLDLRLGVRATKLDPVTRTLTLGDGSSLRYEALLIATGARPRTLPGTPDLAGLYTLRTLDEALALRGDLESNPSRVVVVGAGFIGAEVAATARERGLEVTMLEALPVPLGRVLGADMGGVCADVHRDHGVDLRLNTGVAAIKGSKRVERVELSDGTSIDADVVVVGVGVQPNVEWLDGSGLTVDNGVLCDDHCMAGPAIAAAGDVARWRNRRFDETARVEHWDHAVEMAAYAARQLVKPGGDPFEPVPYFWSDQYDRKIQLAGRPRHDDDVRVVTGSLEERRFAAIYGRGGRIVAVLGMNRPRHVMQYRQLITERKTFDEAIEFSQQS